MLAVDGDRVTVDLQVAGEIDHREQQIADLVGQLVGACTLVELGPEFGNLLFDLAQHLRWFRPVEADPRGPSLQLGRADESGQGKGHVVEHAVSALGCFTRPLRRLDRFPGAALRPGAIDLRRAEHVRVAADHLIGGRRGHLVEVEQPGLLGHLGVIDHLEQEVPQLVPEVVEIAPRDRIGDLVGFLDRVRRDAREVLLEVPRTAAIGIAQPRHHFKQALERRLIRAAHSRRLWSPSGRGPGRACLGAPLRATTVDTRPSRNWISSAVSTRARVADGTSRPY